MAEVKVLKLKKVLKTIQKELDAAKDEGEKFNDGNDSAGTRCRSSLMNLSKLCKPGRDAVMALRNKRRKEKKSSSNGKTETKPDKKGKKKKKDKKKKDKK